MWAPPQLVLTWASGLCRSQVTQDLGDAVQLLVWMLVLTVSVLYIRRV